MTDAVLRVIHAGPLVTIQDLGRAGLMRFGVPASGAMDRFSHGAALAALGLDRDAPAVEVSMGGLSLECRSGTVSFALCGGDFTFDHDGTRLPSWTVRTLHAGQTLRVQPGRSGNWATLAFAGALDTACWLGHAATHSTSGLGGGPLTAGQILHVKDAHSTPEREGEIATSEALIHPQQRLDVPVVIGPQEAQFTAAARHTFETETFRVSPAFDRMGLRLEGPLLDLEDALSIPSEPAMRGSIQVAGDGVATVLMADHQTTGGYPKIATVPLAWTDLLAQARPGTRIKFKPVTPAGAIASTKQIESQRRDALAQISIPRGTFAQRLMRANLISGVTAGIDELT
ncbi:MAG: biotin-dependent carboxyltransferase family protein [Pseudomonadota bacterium]|nr:biotin-dependent carboxyltransferase family protein [Pseudomonadota bacterium]